MGRLCEKSSINSMLPLSPQGNLNVSNFPFDFKSSSEYLANQESPSIDYIPYCAPSSSRKVSRIKIVNLMFSEY
jgi:hypothetical protein